MSKRIFKSIFVVACAVFLACLVIILGVVYDYFTSVQTTQLKAQTALAAQGISNQGADFFYDLNMEGDYRITWIAPDGTVYFDTDAAAESMENHAERPEIERAFLTGFGESKRYSSTLMEQRIYTAQRLSDGSVVRVSCQQRSIWAFAVFMIQPFLVVIVAAILLSAFLASRLSKRLVKPLNLLDLENPLENDTYEELSPLLTRIENQHRQIQDQINLLKRKQQEFSAITDSMNEGLILLGSQNEILNINKSAARLFETDESCVGRDILTISRNLAIQELLRNAKNREPAEIGIELAGGLYQLTASPVIQDDRVSGIVLLAVDVTQKRRSEQMRREFSANVSHELKTPLHSISGCAEIIKNGMVKKTDLPRFIDQIYSEAQRLIVVVDDIIRLSRLDEGLESFPKTEIALLDLVRKTVARLEPVAKEKAVQIEVSGDEQATISGVPSLVSELLYNLCDNAIKYNRSGGSVQVTVSEDERDVSVRVSDTGIGIPSEYQERVFERFFRVDKSHSKAIGGTGLGLSIVKHAALLHDAKIELTSLVGKGTTIRVRFPKPESELL